MGSVPSLFAAASTTPTGDPAATDFMMKCAGCHTIGGGKLTGPDLRDVAAWKPTDLLPKIKTMETKTGPLSPAEIEALARFLKDPKVGERLEARKAQMLLEEEAKYEKGDEKKGGDLFYGRILLAGGGLPCASCHRTGLRGGSFGPDLSPVFAKMGMIPLISACEKASFREMDAIYRDHPITHQEAIHLAKYLESAAGKPTPEEDSTTLFTGAAGLSLFSLGGMAAYYRKKKPGRRAPGRD
jgi:hypothetical protein